MIAAFITIAAILILSFISMMLVGFATFTKVYKRKYDVLCDFPFEMIKRPDAAPAIWHILVVVFCLAQGLLFSTSLLANNFVGVRDLGILMAVLSFGLAVSEVLVFFIPAYNARAHIGSDVAFFCLSILLIVISGITFMNMRHYDEVAAFVFMGAMFLFALFELILIVNPKISHWAELHATQEKDGTIVTSRPRPFVLAFSEWLVIFSNVLASIVYISGVCYFSFNFTLA